MWTQNLQKVFSVLFLGWVTSSLYSWQSLASLHGLRQLQPQYDQAFRELYDLKLNGWCKIWINVCTKTSSILLQTTNCVIGLPRDIDRIHFIEKGIRGGLSFINTRYKSVNINIQEKEESAGVGHQSIRYIDANVRCTLDGCLLPSKTDNW